MARAVKAARNIPADAVSTDSVEPNTATVRINPAADPFKRLGLHGLGVIAPVLVAALATEEPLLLIGPHGTAKSLLLTRVAAALGLPFRHYNASLLNFDDLVGFPLPGKDGQLEYIKTPAAVWGAGAVIFDEISRCRPEIQNKLFPIIHERKVQGLHLEGLRYRWAAMNPPATNDDDNGYLGSEPLDTALADRFAFVIEMPGWGALNEAEQLAARARTIWRRACGKSLSTASASSLLDGKGPQRTLCNMKARADQ
jgi:MoxR-like ATPase